MPLAVLNVSFRPVMQTKHDSQRGLTPLGTRGGIQQKRKKRERERDRIINTDSRVYDTRVWGGGGGWVLVEEGIGDINGNGENTIQYF